MGNETNMLERLGINMPFDGNKGCYLYAEKRTDRIIVNMETNKLLWAAPEMLEALIDIYDSMTNRSRSLSSMNIAIKKALPITKKATGKSWEEIKELM